MLKKFACLFFFVTVLTLLSPLLAYWWGLSLLEHEPSPSLHTLTEQQRNRIWIKEFGVGAPRLKPISPYGYLAHLYCAYRNNPGSEKCASQYPGLRVSALAIRNQVAEQVRGQGNTAWQLAWISYTIWVTRHWDIDQVLATYHDAYNT
ncbi:MAG: hypothetical protein ACFE0K_00175 [Alcanivorax sp.]|uniref:hypothetical protein n=1 Tax=Alcanivorax sp. TaxID=1872427 RepID=UPI003DA71C6E